ncbi:site-specific integrase [Selenomonas sp. TAMA-11512]|uniref:tyrosine-type recombinase/integrase n=1 Tax=Selenomonas sp. TAMA-11512 TaxID=3095337 RepID=UPI003088E3A0|nr:site-specific integrase [Selenomonas sp. TAMA-11512]
MPTKRKDGRYQSSVTIENPLTGEKVKKYIYGYSLKELEAERQRLLKGNIADYLCIETFHNFAEDFILMKRRDDKLEESTLAYYQCLLDRHILPNIPENMKISNIRPAVIKDILAKITGSRTRQAVYTLLNAIFKAAKFEQIAEHNPLDYIHKPKHEATPAAIVTPDIYRALLDEIQGTQTEHLFKFAWDSGLRRGEIVALRWSDFDAKSATVSVSKARKKSTQEYEGKTKSAYSVRTVTLSAAAVKNLLSWKVQLAETLLSKGTRLAEEDYIFRSLKDVTQPMTLTALTHIFASLKKRLGLPDDLRFHSFRHTHATLLAEQEIGVKKIQVRMGHASASFTMDRYVHNTAKMQDGISETMDKISEKYGR